MPYTACWPAPCPAPAASAQAAPAPASRPPAPAAAGARGSVAPRGASSRCVSRSLLQRAAYNTCRAAVPLPACPTPRHPDPTMSTLASATAAAHASATVAHPRAAPQAPMLNRTGVPLFVGWALQSIRGLPAMHRKMRTILALCIVVGGASARLGCRCLLHARALPAGPRARASTAPRTDGARRGKPDAARATPQPRAFTCPA